MAWVHSLDPFALQFTETFGVRWYGLAYLAGFVAGYYTILTMTKRGGTQFKIDQVADFITYVAIGVLAGGRVGYVLFYAPDLLTSVDSHFPYWGVLKVNEGGMASHGGILGVLLVCYLYARYHGYRFWHCQDLTVFGGALGFFFGRLANFVNGELYGRQAPESLAWAVKFPQEMTLWVQKDFAKLSGLGPAVDALGSLKLASGEVVPVNASQWSQWLAGFTQMQSVARDRVYETLEALITATQTGNEPVRAALAPVLTPRHPSQLYQAVLEGLLVFLVLSWMWRKPQKPGVIAAAFATFYCVARIIGEQFRMPDAHIGFQWLGLTRGQWLSLAMLVVAVLLWVYHARANTPRLGGWQPDEAAKRAARERSS